MDQVERWKLTVSLADIGIKSLIAVGVAYLGWIQTSATHNLQISEHAANAEKERFNRETGCWNVIKGTLEIASANRDRLTGNQLMNIGIFAPLSCGIGINLDEKSTTIHHKTEKTINDTKLIGYHNTIINESQKIQHSEDAKIKNLENLLRILLPDEKIDIGAGVPSTDPNKIPSTPPVVSSKQANPQWVAVGFSGTSDFNFTASDGTTLTGPSKDWKFIKARWSVNVRPSAPGWGTTLATLRSGECFKVDATKSLPAGTLTQIWASGAPAPCPSTEPSPPPERP
ncbi:MAG TPA: hypothetical protein PK706_27590 [Xanthobacteraceae bacterium]|jgi:hypothetical protein|nr:hypothetical protein [Xanthobacteraceae bacterium]